MFNKRDRDGFIYLLTVLVVGIVATSVTASFLLMSVSAMKTGTAVQHSSQAMAIAQACAEHGIFNLMENPDYQGNEIQTYENGTCEILGVVGIGSENRTICVDASAGNSTRRLEIIIKRLIPKVQIFSWQEVSVITACSY
ncbi:hypothetical protein HN512_00165 [Candidatus Peregrinibacteria bacterium]|jgi:hypothetical protein|nr:hypothetical protein [Candidatus Peregrinibacteria bacterium]MBT3598243.1 hypothetical protein [Candidatus Peregrinibacteria bacterium]MBT4366958.1 hypothetical protein [Candidatus Peregrinibacteria bacterium]MBT6730992.1 hypothetical protein [Candidatus Peregrinibacteria bacterium]MBT7009613.1 hypothetical protein [Candidatus Peregrinibacteria bacterium]